MNRSSGFTLVEVMVVVVIVGLLAAIAVPNYVGMTNRAREGHVKNNAHTLRLGVEDYAVTNNGFYPSLPDIDLDFFGAELPENPFTGASISVDALGYSRGNLGYDVVADAYTIEGYGAEVTSGPLQNGVVISLHN